MTAPSTAATPATATTALPLSRDQLQQMAELALNHARSLGATDAEVEVSVSVGQNVTVRLDEVETIEYNRDKGLSITAYIGQQKGAASTSDLSRDAIERTVAAACAIAKYTAADEAAGLPDADRLAVAPYPDLGLNTPWRVDVPQSIEIARRMEAAAFAVDKRIDNSEGATVSSHDGDFVYANTRGFMGGYPTSRVSLSASMIASQDGAMQTDYWYSVARGEAGLDSPEEVGRLAGERTVRRLGARRVPTGDVPVLFDPSMASGLISHFVGAVSGSSLYRKASFLLDSLGTRIFAPCVNIREDPHLRGALGSAPFDAEGVATSPRELVGAGTLNGYFLGSYSARKLGMQSTGNAGGNHNLIVEPGALDFAGLVREMGRGLVVTQLMGQGVNNVTGDYSRGAVGFWVENGEIAWPVEEITIASNLKDMFTGIVSIGKDVEAKGSRHVGSILIDRMSVAGE
ncbi:MAG: metalloprotease PmbA [Betaproteobacteria bacterium]|nr:metalloprotease PmbA [Betaproteobacteria bacterium]